MYNAHFITFAAYASDREWKLYSAWSLAMMDLHKEQTIAELTRTGSRF